MDQAFGWVQAFLRSVLVDGRMPAGIASGYAVTPSVGLAVSITTGVAFDKQGRRIEPTVNPVVQSVATDYLAASTAVAADGNERWVSIFAVGGRQFVDAQTDGSGNAVRMHSKEVLNSLGEGTHGVGNYDPVAALEAGINKFYVKVGLEAPLTEGVRPGLMDDGVLVCDIRLIYGQTTIGILDIMQDRRQWLVPSWLRTGQAEQGLYSYENGVYTYGVVREPFLSQGVGVFAIGVTGGSGYIYNASGDGAYHRWDLHDDIHTVPMNPPSGDPRQDLLIIDADGGLRIVTGTPAAADPVPPAVPAGALALAEIRVIPGAVDAATFPIVRRAFRQVPFPYSTMSGIVEGCRLEWARNANSLAVQPPRVVSKRNKVLFDGELVEFAGGVQGVDWMHALIDATGSPYAAFSTTVHLPYFIYVCRNQCWINGSIVGPVVILESTVLPDLNGHPVGIMTGPRGVIQPADALLIGLGWTKAETSAMREAVISDNNGWFHMVHFQEYQGSLNGNTILNGAPNTPLVDMARIKVSYIPHATLFSILTIDEYDQVPAVGQDYIVGPPATTMPVGGTLFDLDIPASAGGLSFKTNHNNIFVQAKGFHINLPRVGFGGL